MRLVSWPIWSHPHSGNHLAQGGQVGDGVSPTLDAVAIMPKLSREVERKLQARGL